MRTLHLATTLALCLGLGGLGHAEAAPRAKAKSTRQTQPKGANARKKPRSTAKGTKKLRQKVRTKAVKVQQVSPRQLGLLDQVRLGPGSDVVHQYATKKGWNKLDATGGSTHTVAVRGGTITFRDSAGKLQRRKFIPEAGTTSRVSLYEIPSGTKVRFRLEVVASTDGGRSYTKRPKDPLSFDMVLP